MVTIRVFLWLTLDQWKSWIFTNNFLFDKIPKMSLFIKETFLGALGVVTSMKNYALPRSLKFLLQNLSLWRCISPYVPPCNADVICSDLQIYKPRIETKLSFQRIN